MKFFAMLSLSLLYVSSVFTMESDVLKELAVRSESDGNDYLIARQNSDPQDDPDFYAEEERDGDTYESHVYNYDSDGADDMLCALHDAVREENTIAIGETLPAMATNNLINSPNNQQQTPLHFAVSQCSTPTVEQLLQNNAKPDSPDADGKTALHFASTSDLVKLLLQASADASAEDNQKRTALHHMAERGNAEALEELLSQSKGTIDVNKQDDRGMTPLHYAAHGKMSKDKKKKKDKLDTIKILLNYQADATIKDNQGRSPIHLAAQSGDADRVGILASRAPMTVDCVDHEGRQPIHYAAERGHTGAVKALVGHGVSVDAADGFGRVPLHYGIVIGSIGLVHALIEELNARVNIDFNGMMPFHQAIEIGNLGIVSILCEQSIDINATYTIGGKKWSPITRAAFYNYRAIIEELLDHNADANSRDEDGNTPLHWTNDPFLAQHLVDHGAHIDAINVNQRTPLLSAAAVGDIAMINFLINHHAEVDWVDALGRSALHYAAQGNHANAIELLLQNKADARACDGRDNTSLHLTTDQRVAKPLLDCKVDVVDVNALNSEQQTPLFRAAASGNLAMVHFLIEHGARIDLVDVYGRTPLHYAATQAIADTFIRLHVDTSVCDRDHKTARERARDEKRYEVVNSLLIAEAARQREALQRTTPPIQESMPPVLANPLARPSRHHRTLSSCETTLVPIQEALQPSVIMGDALPSQAQRTVSTDNTGSPAFMMAIQNLQSAFHLGPINPSN